MEKKKNQTFFSLLKSPFRVACFCDSLKSAMYLNLSVNLPLEVMTAPDTTGPIFSSS